MSRIAKALEVEVFELFKGDLVSEDHKETMSRLSEDIHRNISLAASDVFKRYLG
jgi:hypothetical protein